MRRITPACAGKTGTIDILCNFKQDHPRVCGENLQGGILVDSPEGSPPRVRGKPSRPRCHRHAKRITPACAGKT